MKKLLLALTLILSLTACEEKEVVDKPVIVEPVTEKVRFNTKVEFFDEEGNVSSTTILTCDEKGRVIKEENEILNYTNTFTFDEEGNLVKIEHVSPTASGIKILIDENHPLSQENYDAEGNLTYGVTYEYNDDLKLVKVVENLQGGKIFTFENYLDENGNYNKRVSNLYDVDGNVESTLEFTMTESFDERGFRVVTIENPDTEYKLIEKYDEAGKLVYEEVYDHEGNFVSKRQLPSYIDNKYSQIIDNQYGHIELVIENDEENCVETRTTYFNGEGQLDSKMYYEYRDVVVEK